MFEDKEVADYRASITQQRDRRSGTTDRRLSHQPKFWSHDFIVFAVGVLLGIGIFLLEIGR